MTVKHLVDGNHLVPRNIVDNDWEHLGDMDQHLVDRKVVGFWNCSTVVVQDSNWVMDKHLVDGKILVLEIATL